MTTFKTILPPLSQIIKSHWEIHPSQTRPKNSEELDLLAYRRPKNLKEIIGGNEISGDKLTWNRPRLKAIGFSQPCNNKRSLCCNHIKHTTPVTELVNEYSLAMSLNLPQL